MLVEKSNARRLSYSEYRDFDVRCLLRRVWGMGVAMLGRIRIVGQQCLGKGKVCEKRELVQLPRAWLHQNGS